LIKYAYSLTVFIPGKQYIKIRISKISN